VANFPSIAPVFNAVKNSNPTIRRTKFADGYEQRVKFGLHQDPKEWSLTFMVNTVDASSIETFLEARAADSASFDWTPPDSSTSYKWICDTWSKELLGDSFYKITATFIQVFEP
jgi:phage-related protein